MKQNIMSDILKLASVFTNFGSFLCLSNQFKKIRLMRINVDNFMSFRRGNPLEQNVVVVLNTCVEWKQIKLILFSKERRQVSTDLGIVT